MSNAKLPLGDPLPGAETPDPTDDQGECQPDDRAVRGTDPHLGTRAVDAIGSEVSLAQ